MREAVAWHAMEAGAAAARLGSDARLGLTEAEASARLSRDGPNTITPRGARPAWVRFALQFHAPLVYILLGATGVTLALAEYLDAAVIFGVVLVNAVIGYVQEARALSAIDALSRSMTMSATVRRGGRARRIDAAGLVAGDVVVIEAGDKVPADVRVSASRELACDESMLTGESVASGKRPDAVGEGAVLGDRSSMAYAGALVTRGQGEGVVVATGDRTEVGRVSAMISSAEELATPLTRKIAAFSRVLLWAILGFAAVAFAVGVIRGRGLSEIFMSSVALAVGAIPEGLPAAVTIMLAVGVSRMASRRAIIRRLPAVEALGGTTVICSDKTGTLTQNQMTVRGVWAGGAWYAVEGSGYAPEGEVTKEGVAVDIAEPAHAALHETLRCGALCNDAGLVRVGAGWEIRGDPTEAALLVSARKAALDHEGLAATHPRLDAVPFDSERQYMATLHRDGDGAMVLVKGSVERVTRMCVGIMGPGGEVRAMDAAAVSAAASEMAAKGLRVLAFAKGDAGSGGVSAGEVEAGGLAFLGLQGMLDPPRPEAMEAVAVCRRAGVEVKMITGDHAQTASSIAGMMGIGESEKPRAITGAELAGVPEVELPGVAESCAVFARMTPEQKLRLVVALQSRGHVVAMTGDGVNDGPALRQADIGIAMGQSGTEVAKEAADMVLADDNFASIESAVEEGRSVYGNLTKFIVWTLPTNGGEGLVIFVSIAWGGVLPILPIQALYVNMATGVLLGVPLVFERKDPGVMDRPPRDPREPLLTYELFMRTGFVSLLLCVAALGSFEYELWRGRDESCARAAAVTAIIVGKVYYLFSARALLRPFWSVPAWSNVWLWVGIGAMLAVHLALMYVPGLARVAHFGPLDAHAWVIIWLVGLACFAAVEAEKAIRRRALRGRRDDGV